MTVIRARASSLLPSFSLGYKSKSNPRSLGPLGRPPRQAPKDKLRDGPLLDSSPGLWASLSLSRDSALVHPLESTCDLPALAAPSQNDRRARRSVTKQMTSVS